MKEEAVMITTFKDNKEYWLEIVYIVVIFAFYLGWMVIQPFGVSPDETSRYLIPSYIFNNNALPSGFDPAVRISSWGCSYAFYPMLSGIISAFFMKITSLFTVETTALLMAARTTSLLSCVGTSYMALKIGKRLFARKSLAYMFACFVAFLPQHVFMCSYVNNDSLAIFSSSLIIYFWIRGVETKWNVKSCVGLAVSISVCALSYYNAYGFILCSVILYFATYFLCDKDKKEYPVSKFLLKGMLIVAIVAVLAGWHFIRNAMIYDGDFLGMRSDNLASEMFASEEFKPSNLSTPQNLGLSVFYMLFRMPWIPKVAISFIGWFGALERNSMLPEWMYVVFILIIIIGIVFYIVDGRKNLRLKADGQWNKEAVFNITMLIAMIIPIILNIIYSYSSDYQPQGRYSLPMLLPFAYMLTLGYKRLIKKDNEDNDKLAYGVTGVYVALSVLSYFLVYRPLYV